MEKGIERKGRELRQKDGRISAECTSCSTVNLQRKPPRRGFEDGFVKNLSFR
jgi:hypothetical protein